MVLHQLFYTRLSEAVSLEMLAGVAKELGLPKFAVRVQQQAGEVDDGGVEIVIE